MGPDAGARRGADAGDRRGAVRRAGHRHGPLHVREHRAAGARDGRRAARAGRRRARDLPAPLRGHPAGQARAARARAQPRRALRRRAAHGHAPHARGLPRHGRRRELLRGRRRPPALGRGHAVAALVRDLLGDDGPRRKVSLRATDDRVDVSRDRPRAGRRRAPARGRLLDRPRTSRSWSRSCAPSSRASFDGPRRGPPRRQAGRDHLARRRSRRRAARLGTRREGRPRRHAGPVRDRAAARARRARHAGAAVPDGAAQALRDGGAAGLDVDDGRPRGRAGARADAARPAGAADRDDAPAPAGLLAR